MCRVSAMLVQRALRPEQKQHRTEIAQQMLDAVRQDPSFLGCIITTGNIV